MKDYNEMAESVFERRDRYNVERRVAMNKIKKIISGAVVACLCLVAVGVWHSNISTPTPPPDVDEQVSSGDKIILLSAKEVIEMAKEDGKMGVAVPTFVAYEGAFCGSVGENPDENSQYVPLETEVIFRKNYSYPAYQIKDISDNVAIVINGKLQIYKKLFEIKAVIDGTPYRIVQPMMSGIDYSYGKIIQENEDFTVYQAINAQSGEVMETEYVINILPLLKRELPNLFGGDENYGDAWWVAVPYSND